MQHWRPVGSPPSESARGRLVLADLVLDTRQRIAERAGRRVDLTPKQFGILELLVRNAGIPLCRSTILESVWGYGFETQESAIDVHITALRKKIDAGFATPLIETVKGVGYMATKRATGKCNGRPDE